MTITTVVNIRVVRNPDGSLPEDVVYIGRANRRSGLPESKWANPFKIDKLHSRAEVIDLYNRYLHRNPDLLAALPELRGKRLACWCAPRACHGDVLARLANALEASE